MGTFVGTAEQRVEGRLDVVVLRYLADLSEADVAESLDADLGIATCLANGEGAPLAPGVYELKATADIASAPFPDPALVRVVGH
jgi:hypothetical protein